MSTVLENTDYPSLSLGHPATSCTDVSIVGLELKVYGLDEIKGSNLPVAAVIATHGRCNSQKPMAHFAHGIIGHEQHISQGKKRKRDMIIVTMDQRNHGERTRDRNANLSYDKNHRHLYDMAACVVGGCHDVTLVIDFLGSYLFPNGEKVIEEFIPTGVSLGGRIIAEQNAGNLTWRLLREEPRITIAIPIIGLPFEAFHLYLGARARSMGLKWGPPIYPPSLKPVLETPPPQGAYDGKRILTIHGGSDTLVPLAQGQAQLDAITEQVNASGGTVEVFIKEGAGHVVTEDMIQRTAEWIWRWALSDQQRVKL